MEFKGLTDSEKVTMKSVWDLGDGARLANIVEVANNKYGKEWKPQTVSTFLAKLVHKGYVEQYRDGRYFYYHILIDKHAYRCNLLREEMEFWDDGDMDIFVKELFDKKTFSKSDREKLTNAVKSM